MIRSYCQVEGCRKPTRARRKHKYCRFHHMEITHTRRPIAHQHAKPEKVKKTKAAPAPVIERKGKRK